MNQVSGHKIFKNFGFLITGKVLGDTFTFLLFVALSRAYGQEGIGQYSLAMALSGFFVVFSNFGLYNLSIKEMSRLTGPLAEYYSEIFSLRCNLSIAVYAMLLLLIPFLPFSYDTKIIIALIGANQVLRALADGFEAVFIAREEMYLASLLGFVPRAVIALAGIAIIIAGGSLLMAVISLPTVTLIQLIVAYGIVTRKHGRLRLTVSWLSMAQTLREAIPYAISGFLSQLSSRIDIVFLAFLLGTAAAGIYNAAYRVVFVLMVLPIYASTAIFPLASRLYVNSRNELKSLYHQSLNIVVLVGLPISSGLALVAPNVIDLIYGEGFAESASVLRLVAGLVFLVGLNSIMVRFLISCDRQVERTRTQWIGACVNVLGNVLLIPIFGIKGAAIATLISETIMLIIFAVHLKGLFGWPRVGQRLAMGTVAATLFCVPFAFFPSLSLGVVIPASALIYMGSLASFKQIRKNELSTIVNLLLKV